MDLDFLTHTPFWIALGQIIIIDILLGGDNAVVIALACRKLPAAQRTKGILWGTAGAIILRVILIIFAMTLLNIPFLKVVGAVLLLWIGVKLLAPDEDAHGNVAESDKLLAAIKTIIVAEVVLGLLISIPSIVWGSQLVIKLMERFPFIITAGGMLLGWIAGGMLVTDPAFVNPDKWQWMPKLGTVGSDGLAEISRTLYWTAHVGGALLVLAIGKAITSRRAATDSAPHG